MQYQMYITGASYSDFVIFLPKESSIVTVKKDDYFVNLSVPLLKKERKFDRSSNAMSPSKKK